MPMAAVRVTCSASANVADCAAVGVMRDAEYISGPIGTGVTRFEGPSSGGITTTGGELRRGGVSGPDPAPGTGVVVWYGSSSTTGRVLVSGSGGVSPPI